MGLPAALQREASGSVDDQAVGAGNCTLVWIFRHKAYVWRVIVEGGHS